MMKKAVASGVRAAEAQRQRAAEVLAVGDYRDVVRQGKVISHAPGATPLRPAAPRPAVPRPAVLRPMTAQPTVPRPSVPRPSVPRPPVPSVGGGSEAACAVGGVDGAGDAAGGGTFWQMHDTQGDTGAEGGEASSAAGTEDGDGDDFEEFYRGGLQSYRAGRYEEAEEQFREALSRCPQEDPQLAVIYNNLAATLEKRCMPREAEALYVDAITICEARMAPDHPRIKHIRTKLKELRATLFSFPGMDAAPPQRGSPAVPEDFVSE